MGGITPPDYPTLFFFEVGQWWDYAMLLLVIALLAGGAWLDLRGIAGVFELVAVNAFVVSFVWWAQ